MLRNVSQKTLLTEVPKLFPMLVVSLQFNDADLKLATLETIQVMVKESPDLVNSQLRALMSCLFKLTDHHTKDQGNNARVRALACQTIGQFTEHLGYSSLSVYKNETISELGKVLVDPKRIVRQYAAVARSKWYLKVQ